MLAGGYGVIVGGYGAGGYPPTGGGRYEETDEAGYGPAWYPEVGANPGGGTVCTGYGGLIEEAGCVVTVTVAGTPYIVPSLCFLQHHPQIENNTQNTINSTIGRKRSILTYKSYLSICLLPFTIMCNRCKLDTE